MRDIYMFFLEIQQDKLHHISSRFQLSIFFPIIVFFVFHWNSSKCQQKRGFCIWFYPFLSNLLWSHASIPQLSISCGASLSFWLPITRHMVHRPLRCSGLVRALFGLVRAFARFDCFSNIFFGKPAFVRALFGLVRASPLESIVS